MFQIIFKKNNLFLFKVTEVLIINESEMSIYIIDYMFSDINKYKNEVNA